MKSSHHMRPPSINDFCKDSDIADLWRSHFSNIFDLNCKNGTSNGECMYRIVESDSEMTISAEMVEKAINKLKGNRAPGFDNICEEHLFYAPGCVTVHLAMLFNAMLDMFTYQTP